VLYKNSKSPNFRRWFKKGTSPINLKKFSYFQTYLMMMLSSF